MTIEGNILDVVQERQFFGAIHWNDGVIQQIDVLGEIRTDSPWITPGFVDAHVHVESSLLPPGEFARMAVVHGTIGSVSDPHEIANVLGVAGVEFMLDEAAKVPFKFCFGAPSCVPATRYETAGAEISVADVEALLDRPEIGYLAEMMNFPGVLHQDPDVLAKIDAAQKKGKPVDGHAPGLRGDAAKQYVAAGMSTDHECFTAEEAEEKLNLGMKILIREGSAAKNFTALIPLAVTRGQEMMFCSDDKHPDSLLEGHINQLVARAIQFGVDPMIAFQMASRNPVRHYALSVGLLQPGDAADFVIVDQLETCQVESTYIGGVCVAHQGKSLLSPALAQPVNRFVSRVVSLSDIQYEVKAEDTECQVIRILDGQLITENVGYPLEVIQDTSRDILKLVVVNRYHDAPPAVAFVEGFGLLQGGLASSVAHDSHNIVAVGKTDEDLVNVIQAVMQEEGGLALSCEDVRAVLPLPIAGLMSDQDGYSVAAKYSELDDLAKNKLGSTLVSPFMSLSFLALLVIPSLKLSDLGLFDGDSFTFTRPTR